MTIFISCFFNLVARNVLHTKFFEYLKKTKGYRIILLVPKINADAFKKEFSNTNIIIESVHFLPMSKINLLFHWLSWNLLNTKSKKIHKIVQFGKDSNRLMYMFTSFLGWLGGYKIIRKIFRKLDYWLVPRGMFDYLFNKYKPDMVLATDIQDLRVQELCDTSLVREAKRRGIYSMGMGRSWDSMTTKGLLRTLPTKLVVQSVSIKDQAVRYHSVDSEQIVVTGTLHYDKYVLDERTSRETFFRELGFDPSKKLILLTIPSDIWTGNASLSHYLLNIFSQLNDQIIVRFPLFGKVDIGDFKPAQTMVFDNPYNSDRLEESRLSISDDDHLADLIYHSDVVVTGPSSIILDASIFNKPIVLIGFDGEEARPYGQSMARYYDYEHQQLAILSGGMKVAKDRDQLINLVLEYLANPDLDNKGRRQVAENICFKLDGQSGLRLAQLIWNTLTPKK
ncbi:MAG: CDP-glycerol glycerophosphotransferase family protein [Patescibacteria group bacterium]